MKRIIAFVFIISLFAGNALFAGNDKEGGSAPATTEITGKVFDKNTLEELAGVTVQLEGTDIKAYTDIEGNFKIQGVVPGTYSLNISYISYKETELSNVSIEPASSNEIEIRIEQIN